MKYLITLAILSLLLFSSKNAHAIIKIDSVYADSIYSTFGTLANLPQILHKPDSQYCTLSGVGPTIDLQFRKYNSLQVQTIKANSTILVWAKKDPGVDSSAGQITFWFDDGNTPYNTQKTPITLNEGLNIITVPAKDYTYIELSLAQDQFGKGAKSFLIDAVALVQDTATPVSVSDQKVFQNSLVAYPNPFLSQTNLHFTLQTEGDIQFVVYDALGREVEHINAGYLTTGVHDIPLSITSSGFYFVRLSVNGEPIERLLKITSR